MPETVTKKHYGCSYYEVDTPLDLGGGLRLVMPEACPLIGGCMCPCTCAYFDEEDE